MDSPWTGQKQNRVHVDVETTAAVITLRVTVALMGDSGAAGMPWASQEPKYKAQTDVWAITVSCYCVLLCVLLQDQQVQRPGPKQTLL